VLAVPNLSLSEMTEAGARRISVGGGLTWVAVGAMMAAARAIRDEGDFGALATTARVERWLLVGDRERATVIADGEGVDDQDP